MSPTLYDTWEALTAVKLAWLRHWGAPGMELEHNSMGTEASREKGFVMGSGRSRSEVTGSIIGHVGVTMCKSYPLLCSRGGQPCSRTSLSVQAVQGILLYFSTFTNTL